jgi:hypothetical protein
MLGLDEVTWAELDTLAFDIIATVAAVSRGRIVQRRVVAQVVKDDPGAANNPQAHRELKWLVTGYQNVTHTPFSVTIPCANFDFLDPNNTDNFDKENSAWSDLVTRFQSAILTPSGQGVTITDCRLIGRNS